MRYLITFCDKKYVTFIRHRRQCSVCFHNWPFKFPKTQYVPSAVTTRNTVFFPHIVRMCSLHYYSKQQLFLSYTA